MPFSSRRGAALALLAVLLSSCGGGSSTPAPSPLELACAVSLAGSQPVLTVIGRLTPPPAAGTPPVTVSVPLTPTPITFTLGEPGWAGLAEGRPDAARVGSSFAGQTTLEGAGITASCQARAGLPTFSARVNRRAGGAALSWGAVAGAAIYRWALRDLQGGALAAIGATTGTTDQVTAALDPARLYQLEVGAYALTGTETSYPSPLPVPAASFARALLTGGAGGGDGFTAWQLFSPDDYVGTTLTVNYPVLAAGERLAVLLVNAGGDDMGLASVNALGTGSPSLSLAPVMAAAAARPAAPGAVADEGAARDGVLAGEALVTRWREETMARLGRDGLLAAPSGSAAGSGPVTLRAAVAALPATRSFCQARVGDGGVWAQSWQPATLAYETAHAGFYFTDEVKAGIDAAVAARGNVILPPGVKPFFGELGNSYEQNILPALTTYFGPESDVDGNGKMIFLFANLGMDSATKAFPIGFFWPSDISARLATAATCSSQTVGNRTDMLYLLDPGSFTANWGSRGDFATVLGLILDGEYQGVMAHELQHDVNYAARHLQGGGAVEEQLWLNEGLSMLSETVAGYGLHTATSRANVRSYQGRSTPTSLPYYQGYGMTIWPAANGDPYGNYAGAQAYLQYLLDQADATVIQKLENPLLAGKTNVERATGIPWEVGFARFVTAAMFSNEDQAELQFGGLGTITSAASLLTDPLFNYLGDGVSPDYVPWHHYQGFCTLAGNLYPKPRVANVAYTPLLDTGSATLRTDGWAAFATGPGAGGAATITVRSTATARPWVVVVKYGGKLPDYVAPDTTCP